MPSITPEEAKETLAGIDDIARQTRRLAAGGPMGSNLLLWGVVWFLGFSLSYLSPPHSVRIWLALGGLGMAGSLFLGVQEHRKGLVRSAQHNQLMGQLALFWLTVIAYAMALAFLFPFSRPMDDLPFIVCIFMMAYVLMGIWVRSGVLCAIGLAVTAATLAGRAFLSPHAFLLWMAFFGGGGLFFPGLYIKRRWK